MPKRHRDPSPSSSSRPRPQPPSSRNHNHQMPGQQGSGGGRFRGPKRPRGNGGGGGGGGRGPRAPAVPPPAAPGPVHDQAYVLQAYAQLGGRGQPNNKCVARPLPPSSQRRSLAPTLTSSPPLSLRAGSSRTPRASSQTTPRPSASTASTTAAASPSTATTSSGAPTSPSPPSLAPRPSSDPSCSPACSVTVVADPDPPPPAARGGMYNSASGPAMPPMIEPIIGTGDASSVKEAEKLAAIHACLQLSARGLFTNVRPLPPSPPPPPESAEPDSPSPLLASQSNLPTRTRGQFTPLHAASQTVTPTYSAGPSAFFDGPAAAPSSYPQQPQAMQPMADKNDGRTVALSNGQRIGLEEARAFMDYYCEFSSSSSSGSFSRSTSASLTPPSLPLLQARATTLGAPTSRRRRSPASAATAAPARGASRSGSAAPRSASARRAPRRTRRTAPTSTRRRTSSRATRRCGPTGRRARRCARWKRRARPRTSSSR